MDSINFLGKDNYPVSADTLDMMQSMTKLAASLALLGGDNYILSGCVDNGVNVTPGTIVIAGLPYIFVGGAKGDKITISETKPTLVEEGEEFPEAYTKRIAMFAENGAYLWGDFKRVLTNQELEEKFDLIRGTPLGIPEMWAGYLDKIPENYRLCDGSILSIIEYNDLFKVLGTLHGGDGLNGFALPDLRQRFIVGYDNSHDSYKTIGGKGGEETHKLTIEEMPEHKHIVPWGENLNTAWQPEWSYPSEYFNNSRGYNAATDLDNTWPYSSPSGGNKPHENRPPFFTLAFIMKIKA